MFRSAGTYAKWQDPLRFPKDEGFSLKSGLAVFLCYWPLVSLLAGGKGFSFENWFAMLRKWDTDRELKSL